MTTTEIQLINRTIALLRPLTNVPPEATPESSAPIERFVHDYLEPDANDDLSCLEAWTFFNEIVRAGQLPPMRKSVFLRQLPVCMEAIHHARKSHHLERAGHRCAAFAA